MTNAAIATDAINATSIADGSITNVLISDGTIQEAKLSTTIQTKLSQMAPVASVAGKTGTVVLDKTDVGLNNVDNTSDSAKDSAATTLTNKTITDPKINAIKDSNGNTLINMVADTNAVNYIQMQNANTGSEVQIRANGTDTNVNLVLRPKGSSGSVVIRDSSNIQIANFRGVTSAINIFQFFSSAAGSPLQLQATGSDTNTSINIVPKGTGTLQSKGIDVVVASGAQTLTNKTLTDPIVNSIKDANGNTAVSFATATNAVNNVGFTNSASGSSVIVSATGSDTNINLNLRGKNSGLVSVQDGVDGSKIARINVSGLTSGVTRTIFVPDTDLTLVGTASAQTLTNKTITSPILSGSTIFGQASYFDMFNTVDQTINYEKVRHQWGGNSYTITVDAAGTGVFRPMRLSAGGRYLDIGTSSAHFDFASSTSSAIPVVRMAPTLTTSSGSAQALGISPTINQTGAAGYTALLVNPTETAVGTGTKLLFDTQVAGSSKFRIDNVGIASMPQSGGLNFFNTSDQVTNYERARMSWSGNVFQIWSEIGGTGANRSLGIGSGTNHILMSSAGGSSTKINMNGGGSAITGVAVSGTYSSTGASATVMQVVPIINQTGTAGYTALLVNATETATGSGTKNLLDLQVGGASKVSITNLGQLKLNASTTNASTMNIPTGVAPTSPVAGDVYSDGTHVYCYLASTWKQLD